MKRIFYLCRSRRAKRVQEQNKSGACRRIPAEWKNNLDGGLRMTAANDKEDSVREINLEEVAKLIDALEQDLKKVQGGSRDMQLLRDEVETLKNVLNSPVRRHHWVRDGLHGIREAFENALDKAIAEGMKGSRYIAEIGRILGM